MWIDIVVADYYLATIWHESQGLSQIRFILNQCAKPFYDHVGSMIQPSNEERAQFMHDHYIPLHEDQPLTPIAFLVHHHGHFFGAVFDYASRIAYILGRKISNEGYDPHWRSWNGPDYWRRVAQLHLWDTGNPEEVFVLSQDWDQNDYDCGPTACAVLQRCLQDGLEKTWQSLNDGDAQVPCGHILRRIMLGVVKGRCLEGYRDYMQYRTNPPLHWVDMALEEEDLQDFPSGHHQQRDDHLLRSLTIASNSCRDCHSALASAAATTSKTRSSTKITEEELEERDLQRMEDNEFIGDSGAMGDLTRERSLALLALIKDQRILLGARNRTARRPRTLGSTAINVVEDEDDDIAMPMDEQRSKAATASRKRVEHWRLGSASRFPRHTNAIILPAYGGQRFFEHDHQYDEYEHGPTLEMLQQPEVCSVFALPYEQMTQVSAWTMWRDHGYRLVTDSFQMFYLGSPVRLMDHVMTFGEVKGYNPSCQVSERVVGNYSLDRGVKSNGLQVIIFQCLLVN